MLSILVVPDSASRLYTRYTIKNALSPFIWMMAICEPTLLYFAFQFRENPDIVKILIGGALGLVALFIFAYFWLFFFDRSRLQSEGYQLRHEAMQMYQNNPQPIDVTENGLLKLIANPEGKENE